MQAYEHFCDPVEMPPADGSQSKKKVTSKVGFEKIQGKRIFVVTDFVKNSKKLVIMSHGFRGNCCGPARQFVTFAQMLNQAGFSTLRFDQPNCGNSQGDYLDVSFAKWVQTTTYFAKKYLKLGYQIALMGQSMGASTSVVAAANKDLTGKISHLLLWVPDPKSDMRVEKNQIYEEDGEKYYGKFWLEARDSDFVSCLEKFSGPIHLVYGEEDRYVAKNLRMNTIKQVGQKNGQVLILSGENHSPWKFDTALMVMKEQLELLLN